MLVLIGISTAGEVGFIVHNISCNGTLESFFEQYIILLETSMFHHFDVYSSVHFAWTYFWKFIGIDDGCYRDWSHDLLVAEKVRVTK